ncbi:uncharacterized protein F5891DRAFT_1160685 [Suillus fuscotomentosus]|uniref:DUF7702 domain-containing protein n=1 Tax=Suillus fuscotomentosus TaxID=1912939 RepID=A0AAD4HUU8_9AGAM|nr:uncharacterized protein F5891DRAFT_1160685 [Suillus fuscotomentosus]KAG1849349.1 hypothetical protein C8R48DRAFT_641317 [Suillus tomentosus]KAG1908831.1 hypothetical protein F5891DRAFT_1160685 [Suillus fuscotomentosus]
MALDTQGILAAVTIAMYIPFLFVSLRLVMKYGMSRGDGWVLLLVFSIIRVLGGALLVAAEDITPANISLYIGGYALESSGLSPLLLCTLGLLHSMFQTPDGFSRYNRQFRLLQILGMVALILTITGISNETSSSSSSSGNTMRRAGVILFCALYIILVGICVHVWTQVGFVMRYRKQLLKAISIALPFLAIRTLYSVLSTFSSDSFSITGTTEPNTSDLAKFNILTGEWQIYLVMDMLMEYAVVIIYAVAGIVLPLNEDYKSADSYQDEYPLSRPQM